MHQRDYDKTFGRRTMTDRRDVIIKNVDEEDLTFLTLENVSCRKNESKKEKRKKERKTPI